MALCHDVVALAYRGTGEIFASDCFASTLLNPLQQADLYSVLHCTPGEGGDIASLLLVQSQFCSKLGVQQPGRHRGCSSSHV